MKRAVDGGKILTSNPFAGLSSEGLRAQPPAPPAASVQPPQSAARKSRGRVEVRRETKGRGGKVVTTASGFLGIGAAEKEAIAQAVQKRSGCGGSVKEGIIEIQGDQRDALVAELRQRGFQPVLAGG